MDQQKLLGCLMVIACLGFSGCSGDDNVTEFLANKGLWQSKELITYEYLWNQEVDGIDYPEIRVSIVNDLYDFAYFTTTGEILDEDMPNPYFLERTFNNLFDQVEPWASGSTGIKVRYDADLGYITYIDNFNADQHGEFWVVNITLIK